jgi:Regulator of ribonuclease activity B
MSETFKQEVLDQLRESGSDIAKPHKFEFYLYVLTKVDADIAAAKMLQSGFLSAKVSKASSDNSWLCLVGKTLVPIESDLNDHARFFREVAAALGGEFDGWEAEIVA